MELEIAETILKYSEGGMVLKENYSGRGMYGVVTAGLIVEKTRDFFDALIRASINEPEIMQDAIGENFETDQLGFNIIFY